jgi:hypothetical protein
VAFSLFDLDDKSEGEVTRSSDSHNRTIVLKSDASRVGGF